MKLILSILGILLCHIVYTQYDNVWIYGTGGNVLGGLDFKTTPPTPFSFPIERVGGVQIFGETTASISDEEGKLLFATDGYHIWNREGKLMPNGRGVNFKMIDTTYDHVGSASQGSLIVKVPCEEDLYYVFAVGQQELRRLGDFGDLYYSLVDMSLNNGLGDVVADKKSILLNKGYSEHMTVVRGRGNYLWLLVLHTRQPVGLHAYKISVQGIDTVPVVSSSPTAFVGWLVGNHKSDKLALTYLLNRISIMDFDNGVGRVVGSPYHITDYGTISYGVCFSPNDSLLYVTEVGGRVTQYELYNNYAAHVIKENAPFSAIQKGADDKLYFLSEGSVGLHVINYPDRVGEACSLELNAVNYAPPVRFNGGLPNTIGVFKSDKRVTTVAHHHIAQMTCGKNIMLYTTDTIPEKTTLWNTGAIGDSIAVNKSGVYVASTFSTSVCWEHIDSYFVDIPEPVVELDILPACPNVENGRIKAVISNIATHYIQNITWYNAQRDQILGYGDSLTNLGGGKYWVHIRFTGCDTMLEAVVPRLEDRVSFTSDSLICTSTRLGIQNTSGDGYTSFEWYHQDSLYSTQADISIVLHDTGLTRLTLIGEMEHCRDTVTRFIQVDPAVAIQFKVNPQAICAGEKIDIIADSHYTIKHYIWHIGKHRFRNHSAEFSISMEDPGEYPIQLSTTFRICPDTSYQFPIKVHANPEVYLGADSGLCYQGKSIILQNLIDPPTNTNTYLWSTGDTTKSIQVKSPGLYSLMQSSEPIGCTGYGSIEISKDCFVDIPNAFTPNGDGVNDYFFPRKWLTNGVEQFYLQIFNRWGQLIFETYQTEGLGWDGKWNGQTQPMGVYVYRITVALKNGTQESYEGNVTLVR